MSRSMTAWSQRVSLAERNCSCQYPTDWVPSHTSFKARQGEWRASTHCHVCCSSGPCLPAEVGSGVATCLLAPDSGSLLRRAPVLPCVTWLWTPPLCLGGHWCYNVSHDSSATTCHMALDPASLLGRSPVLPRASRL
jgi:hypothetical protein